MVYLKFNVNSSHMPQDSFTYNSLWSVFPSVIAQVLLVSAHGALSYKTAEYCLRAKLCVNSIVQCMSFLKNGAEKVGQGNNRNPNC